MQVVQKQCMLLNFIVCAWSNLSFLGWQWALCTDYKAHIMHNKIQKCIWATPTCVWAPPNTSWTCKWTIRKKYKQARIVLPTLAYLMSSEMLNQLNVITLWLITKLNCITLLTLLESIIYISCVYFQVYSNTLLKKPNLHSKIIVYIVKYWWSCSQRF